MEDSIQLPKILEPFRDQITATGREAVKIVPRDEPPATPWQSAFGGHPYLPKQASFPVNPEGEQLFFLAQINFEEAPPAWLLPPEGLLQFFIFDRKLYGMNPEAPEQQDNFRVIFYPEVIRQPEALVTDFSFLRQYRDIPLEGPQAFALDFKRTLDYLPVNDYRFEQVFGKNFFQQFEEASWEAYDEYYEALSPDGHKLGGYPDFAQEDPRTKGDELELLFQMDSDYDIECMWGDLGVGNFFIRPDDLKARDFSRVLYHWDCN